jgi:hypothetical protein
MWLVVVVTQRHSRETYITVRLAGGFSACMGGLLAGALADLIAKSAYVAPVMSDARAKSAMANTERTERGDEKRAKVACTFIDRGSRLGVHSELRNVFSQL